MPFATRRSSEELNRAYAHVSERNFYEAAEGLHDRLVDMGFDEQTALAAIVEQPPEFDYGSQDHGLLYEVPQLPVLTVAERPDQSGWSNEMMAAIRVADDGSGGVAITFDRDAPEEVLRAVAKVIATSEINPEAAVEAFIARRAIELSPAERGETIRVPQLTVEWHGQIEIAYPETLVDVGGWNLAEVDVDLPGFALTEQPDTFEMDVDGGHIVWTRIDADRELALDDATDWDAATLSRWLDRQTRQQDVSQPIYLEYCRRVVERLETRIPLAHLVRGKYALKRAIVSRVQRLRREAGARGMQLMLTELMPALQLGENGFSFSKAGYDPRTPYSGPWKPRRHFFAQVGDLKHGGEEWQCAVTIDSEPAVKHWVRNVDRTPWSYWLPTSTDKFYPDFIAELNDGRLLVVEYKGAHIADGPDSREKRNIGARLQEVSGGQVLFWWAEDAPSGNMPGELTQLVER
jgi:type III restriction enzyme